MDDWTDTALRLKAYPEFVWTEGMLIRWVDFELEEMDVQPPQRLDFTGGKFEREDSEPIPDLTDLSTVGILLGLVVEQLKRVKADWWLLEGGVSDYHSGSQPYMARYSIGGAKRFERGTIPGQALGLLWLQLIEMNP